MSKFAAHIKLAIESQEIASSGDHTLVAIPEVNEVAADEDTPETLQAMQEEFEKDFVEIEEVADDLVQAQTDVKLIDAGIDLIGAGDEKNEVFEIQVTAVEALSRMCRLAQERYGITVKSPATESLTGKDAGKAIKAYAKEAEETSKTLSAKIKAGIKALIQKLLAFIQKITSFAKKSMQGTVTFLKSFNSDKTKIDIYLKENPITDMSSERYAALKEMVVEAARIANNKEITELDPNQFSIGQDLESMEEDKQEITRFDQLKKASAQNADLFKEVITTGEVIHKAIQDSDKYIESLTRGNNPGGESETQLRATRSHLEVLIKIMGKLRYIAQQTDHLNGATRPIMEQFS